MCRVASTELPDVHLDGAGTDREIEISAWRLEVVHDDDERTNEVSSRFFVQPLVVDGYDSCKRGNS